MTRRDKSLAPLEGEREVLDALRAAVDTEGVRGLATRAKVPASLVSRALRQQSPVSAKLAKVVGFEKVILYRRVIRYEREENAMTYVYIKTEPRLWTVGFYDPQGRFQPESDHGTPEEAAQRVHYLNGGVPAGYEREET